MGTTKKRKNKKNKIILFVVEIIVLVALLVGLYVYSLMSKVETPGVTKEEEEIAEQSIELSSETAEVLEGYTNIALFGLDNRTTGNYDGGNSDCIMIASINNDTKEVKLVSVYRDTFLNVKEDTYNKINSAYSYGGPSNAIAALNKNLNLDIKDYVAVDFGAVVEAVDLLGGIELTFTDEEAKIMNDNYIEEINEVTGHNTSLLPGGGTYQADGVYALAYCRIRYTAGDDFKRTERQRTVLTQMIEKAKGSSIATVGELIESMIGDIKTSYTSKEMLALASQVMDYELVGTHGWPFELCTGTFGSKGSIVVPTDLETNVEELHEYLFGEKTVISNTVQGISDYIVNYTGCTTEAASRKDNPLTGDDNTSTTDTGYVMDEAASTEKSE
ncbi:MAG: LCP family protein [Lachnospiraceae bacterium]|nr:LCP family protein [Lachnospiraceae bacterium]